MDKAGMLLLRSAEKTPCPKWADKKVFSGKAQP
jgi:hypothetical protein